MQRRRKGPRYRPNTPESGVFVRPTLVGGDGLLPYHLALEPILAAKVSTIRTVVVQLGKESPTPLSQSPYRTAASVETKGGGHLGIIGRYTALIIGMGIGFNPDPPQGQVCSVASRQFASLAPTASTSWEEIRRTA